MTKAASKPKVKPRNGTNYIALVVGGIPAVHQKLKDAVLEVGVDLAYFWFNEKNLSKKAFPPEVDLVLLVKDQNTSRAEKDKIAYNCKKAGIHYVFVFPSPKSAVEELRRYGYDTGIKLDISEFEEPIPEYQPPVRPVDLIEEKLSIPPLDELENTKKQVESVLEKYIPKPEPKAAPLLKIVEPPSAPRKYGNLVYERRTKLDISVSEMAKDLEITPNFLRNIEKESTPASDVYLAAIEYYLGMDTNTLPRGLNDRQKKSGPPRVLARTLRKTLVEPKEETPKLGVLTNPPPKPVQVTEENANPCREVVLSEPVVNSLAPPLDMLEKPKKSSSWTYEDVVRYAVNIKKIMKELGITKVEITQSSLQILEET